MPHLKFVVLISAIFLIGPRSKAQSLALMYSSTPGTTREGDYRTEASGAWNRDSTWARFTSGGWVSPAAPPDSDAGTTTVRNGHTVTITSAIVYDQLVVESGGCIIVAPGIGHTLSDGPGNDLTIVGTWINRGGVWTILGAARWLLADSGTFIQQSTSGISTPLSKSSISSGSTFIYRGGNSAVPASSFSGRTYGNLSFDTCGGPWTCTATGSSSLLLTGSLSLGPGVKWSTGGFSGNITVQGVTFLGGEWNGTGTGSLGTHLFAGRFEISPTGKYQLATTGARQGAIIFQGDFKNDGLFSFAQNRQIIFGGHNAQTLGGASATVFNNGFTVANASGILLDCSITVDGNLLLSSGNLITGTHALTLGPGGSVNEDSVSAVLGTLRATRSLTRGINESFGNIGLEIKALANDPGLTEVTRVTGAPAALNARQSISRYFEAVSSVNENLDATLKFHYRDSDLGSANEVYLTMYTSTNDGAAWLPAGGELDTATNVVCLDNVNSLSRWTLGEFFPEPSLSRISPSLGSPGDQLDILVEGSGFVPAGTELVFSGAGITVESVIATSARELRVHIRILPDASIGNRDVSVTSPGGRSTLRDGFRVEGPPNPVPLLSRVRPTTGIRAQVLTVTLEGSGLLNGVTLISFGDSIEVVSLIANASSLIARIRISEEATLGPRDVGAVNVPPGGGVTVLRNAFSVINPMPTLTLASPGECTLGDSVSVFLTGSDFVLEGAEVSFGDGIEVDSIVVVDRTLLRVRLSVSSATYSGPREITVTNPAPGGGTATLVDGFCVTNPAPTISSIAPSVCVRGRSALLTITGKDFVPGISTVSLSSGIKVDSIHTISSDEIVMRITIARDFALGFTPVTVKNPWPGGGSSSIARRLEVQNPSPIITGISPNRGVLGQSLEVALTGADFFDLVSSVAMGDDVAICRMSCDSGGTNLRATIMIAESALVGERSVVVRNSSPGGGESVLKNAFTVGYPAPLLVSVNPVAALKGQRLDVVLIGENFVPGGTKITFSNGISVNSIHFESHKKLVASITVSPDAVVGARAVVVTNPEPGGGSAELRHVFNVEHRPPKIISISPSEGVKGRKMVVAMEGAEFFDGVTTAEFGAGIAVDSVIVRSQTDMDACIRIAADAASGSRDVRVLNSLPGGGSDSLKGAFIVRNPPPEIASVNPDRAEKGRVLTVLIKGDRFVAGVTTISFGADVTVAEIIVRNQNELEAIIEIGSSATPGPRTVTVTNEGQNEGRAVLKDGFVITPVAITFLGTESPAVPDHYVLYQPFPNPFNLSTRIRFGLPERSRTKIEVYNMLGNLIDKLVDDVHMKGFHELSWNAEGLPSGIYVVRLAAQSLESERRVVGSRRVALIK